MKRICLALALLATLVGTACSNQGAYSEEEKKTQDSADNVKHEKTFEQMEAEQQAADSIANLAKDSSGKTKPQ